MNARVVYSLVSGVAIASACAFACSGNDGATGPTTDKDAGEDAHPSGLDGATNEQDSGSSGDDALLPGGWETTPPSDFPAHFAGISPPSALDDLTGLCAIDTGSATGAPSFSICKTPSSTPVVVTTSPNLVVVDGVNALVLWADTLDIKDDVKVTGTRALALFETHTLTIDGTIDVSAIGSQAGPGAVTSGNGAPGNSSANDFPGGGGGGFGANGGLGGDASDAGAGIAYGADAAAFTGGSSGGYATQTTCAAGGGGGGAIQISVAGSLLVMQKGAVLANGGGGQGACATSLGAGAGGGSGGTIFLESLALFSIEGKILANGGGGGGSSPAASTKGERGDDANLFNTPAGGGSAGANGASGGNGGIGVSSAEDGASFFVNPQTLGGGGGGAIGRIWIRSQSAPTGSGATFGPPPVGLTF